MLDTLLESKSKRGRSTAGAIISVSAHTALIAAAFVYHKRRVSWRQFFKQVHNSGIARINLYLRQISGQITIRTFLEQREKGI